MHTFARTLRLLHRKNPAVYTSIYLVHKISCNGYLESLPSINDTFRVCIYNVGTHYTTRYAGVYYSQPPISAPFIRPYNCIAFQLWPRPIKGVSKHPSTQWNAHTFGRYWIDTLHHIQDLPPYTLHLLQDLPPYNPPPLSCFAVDAAIST